MAIATAPMPSSSTRPMTAEDFAEFVERDENQNKRLELVRGKVVEMSRPKIPHGFVTSNIVHKLMSFAEKAGIGYVVSESGILTERDPDSVRGPDVAYFDDVKLFDDLEKGWAETPPRLAVEVRSPGDSSRKLLGKVDEYLAMGVPVVWLVDYEERFVTVYRPTKKHITFDDGDVLICEELNGFSCLVSDLFRLPGEKLIS